MTRLRGWQAREFGGLENERLSRGLSRLRPAQRLRFRVIVSGAKLGARRRIRCAGRPPEMSMRDEALCGVRFAEMRGPVFVVRVQEARLQQRWKQGPA